MKIIQHIKAFTQKTVNKLLDLIAPNRHKNSDKKKNDSQHRKIKKKRSHHKRSFSSLKSLNPFSNFWKLSRSRRKQRKFSILSKWIGRKQSSSLSQIKSQSSQHSQLNLGEIATNEVIMVATGIQISDGQLFLDNNGLQISAIELQGRENPLNKQEESDSQILKFVLGDDLDQKEKKPQENIQRKIQYIIPKRKQWWLQALQSEETPSKCAPVDSNECEEIIEQQSKSLSFKSKAKKIKKIKHEDKKRISYQLKKKMKVIEIIDLVQNQDRPKTFHVPLCKPIIF